MKKLLEQIKTWWIGTYIPEPPNSPLVFGIHQKHWTSKLAHNLWNFYLEHWKWVWSTALGCGTFYLGILRLNGCY
ncbi:hypothetical protein [Cellvibrio sp. KY-GH-1]|uniref:hypothetical protein n=1 Tax=Cellvibrio sp. KY-GH-1 TaxID=2303332 RepID=UPI001248E73F|nr:hypothetical protein [Cellvibrio sp. KY-GH-1]